MPLAAFPKCFLDELVAAKTMTLAQWIDMAADQLDIDGLEFYYGFVPKDAPSLENIHSHLVARRLRMPMMCYSPDFTKPGPAERQEEVEKAKGAIDATAALGGKFCRVLSGQRRPDVSRQEGIRMAAECISSLLPYAGERGVTLIIENHYKDSFWDYPEFAQKMDAFLELLAAIPASPWFGVNYDPSNAIIAGDDPIALLEAVKERVVTMHASDRYFEGGTIDDLRKIEADPQKGYAAILKHGVIGQGMNDYDRIFAILKSVGFRGWVSIEDGQDPKNGMEHLRLSANFLRAKMAQHGLG
ncbi:MAG TPA: sugar phosphate isomerase/epimerase family protein [Capsulimonadaceae bacterium]|nr:sugar phosphate isomerase/epimerase family protein [Capsulimonadaceae bacterium]